MSVDCLLNLLRHARSRSKDPYDSGYGGGYGGGSSYDRPESYRCYRARAWESYENDITGMVAGKPSGFGVIVDVLF
jgi:hypothetical protein